MKKLLLIILFIQISVPIIYAQEDYMSFVKEGKTWIYPVSFIYNFSHDVTCTIKGDTIIGETGYKRMYSKGALGYETIGDIIIAPEIPVGPSEDEWIYYGAIREDGKKVYFIPNGFTEEYLLYDFALSKGDKIRGEFVQVKALFGEVTVTYGTGAFLVDSDNLTEEYVVEEVDTVVVSGNNRRRIKISATLQPSWTKNIYWIEGIGALEGLMNPFMVDYMYSYKESCLSCYEGNTRIYGNDDFFCLSPLVPRKERVSLPINSSFDFQVDGICYKKTSDSEVGVTYNNLYERFYTGVIKIPENIIFNGTNYSVTSICDGAFYHCETLDSIVLPNSIRSIGHSAFAYCHHLRSFSIPENLISLGERLFDGCKFNQISITDIRKWCELGFMENHNNNNNSYRLYSNGKPITDICVPEGTIEICNYCFRNCVANSMTIPSTVKTIGKGALDAIVDEMTIVCDVGDLSLCSIFWYVLKALTIYNENPPIIDYRNSPAYSSRATIFVPSGCGDRYRAAEGWKDFPNIIEMEGTGIENVSIKSVSEENFYDLQGRRLRSAPQRGVYIRNGKKVVVR